MNRPARCGLCAALQRERPPHKYRRRMIKKGLSGVVEACGRLLLVAAWNHTPIPPLSSLSTTNCIGPPLLFG